jgi:hypothetical protein
LIRLPIVAVPYISFVHVNLGNAIETLVRMDNAVDSYCWSIDLDPAVAEGHSMSAPSSPGRENWVKRWYGAIKIGLDYREAWNNLASVLFPNAR